LEPDKQFLKRVTKAVDARLSGKRLAHVHSVSDYAVELARIYSVNEYDARIAGLLHDWDKLLTDDELPARLDELGIERPDDIEYLYPVLHSFTGAAAVQREYPELSDDIASAIRNHTLGAVEMSDLDIIIFVADMVEPLRKTKGRPEIKNIRKMVGKVPLGELYFAGYCATMKSLVERRRFIHPMAFDIWNDLVEKYHPIDKSRQGDSNVVL
jgi:predicted HD superfamily hydrolase involved in NAD metabolism